MWISSIMESVRGIPRLTVVLLVAIICSSVCTVNSVNLHPNGGYDLVVAVEEGADLASVEVDQERYIQNVKNSLQVFSHQLWRATKQKFFVNSVDLLLPSTWNLTAANANGVSATRDYRSSDFRISSKEVFPYAENPNLCGVSGKFVELPLSFFKSPNSNAFGPLWKTLLFLFARYRYGVWEEHGYAGDGDFPYFYENIAEQSLGVTGCSNQPLLGKYRNISTDEECSVGFGSSEEDLLSCRFMPDRVQNTASTSLMHFHWMDSVVDFCDHSTHNRFAENKQNIYCDHQSVMEVISKTRDYLTVTNTTEIVPALTFNVIKQSSRPLLYLLLDKGSIQGSYAIAREVPLVLSSFLSSLSSSSNPASDEIIAAIGSYPSGQPGSFIKEEIDWTPLKPNVENFIEVVGSLRIDGPVERDFSRAILEVTEKIRTRNHPGGAVVVIVKYGADLANLSKAAPESELIIALNEQNIILNSIELAMTGESPKAHLSQVVRASYGSYATLTSVGEAAATARNVLNYAQRTLLNDYSDLQRNRRTIGKSPFVAIDAPIQTNATNIEFYFNSETKLEKVNFTIYAASNVAIPDFRYWRTTDWLEAENRTKFTYRFRVENPSTVTNGSILTLRATCGMTSCPGTSSARTELPRNDGTNASPVDSDVTVDVSTTTGAVDLSRDQPISVFVKVMKSGQPVGNVLVEVMLTHTSTGQTSYIALHDDGVAPDVTLNDGIYAGYLLPPNDGVYTATIKVEQSSSKLKHGVLFTSESRMGRLLPIDQKPSPGCVGNECPMENVADNYIQFLSAPHSVVIANVSSFLPSPGRPIILYRRALRKLTWFAPRVADPQQSTNAAVERFELRTASSQTELMTQFDSCTLVETIPGRAPGQYVESVELPITVDPMYYAVKAVYKNMKSQLSNMYASQVSTIVVPNPDPSDPTQSPGPTSSTTPSTGSTNTNPTQSPGPTDPNQTTTESTGSTSTSSPPTDNSSTRMDISLTFMSFISVVSIVGRHLFVLHV